LVRRGVINIYRAKFAEAAPLLTLLAIRRKARPYRPGGDAPGENGRATLMGGMGSLVRGKGEQHSFRLRRPVRR